MRAGALVAVRERAGFRWSAPRWRGLLAAVLVAGAAGAAPAPASADEQPSILKAYNLDWIERVREEAWPQPKSQRPVICLLDTGVNVTPDTPADHPDGPIVARLAIDGRGGEAQGSAFEHLHGTQMASIIAAPRNDWGTVGIFPQARIVSVRVTVGDAIHITPADVKRGVDACTRWATIHGDQSVAAIAMAESRYDQRTIDVEAWQSAAVRASALDIPLVAAIGNEDNAALVAPLAVNGIVSVAPGGPDGALCPFSPPGSVQGVIGPGCSDGGDWPTGSSSATAATAGLMAAIATRAPSLRAAERIAMVTESGNVSISAPRALTGARVARELFDGLVDSPFDANTVVTPVVRPVPPLTPAAARPSPPVERLLMWKPRVTATWKQGRLVVRRHNRRAGRLMVRVVIGRARLERSTRRATLRFPRTRRPRQVTAWIESKQPGQWRSLSTRVGARRAR